MHSNEMPKTTQALVYLARNDIITADGLNAVWGGSRGTDALGALCRRGAAAEIRLQTTVGEKGKRFFRTGYIITRAGMEELASSLPGMDEVLGDYRIGEQYLFKKKADPETTAVRFLKETAANVFFIAIGVKTFPLYIGTGDPRRVAVPEVSAGNMGDWEDEVFGTEEFSVRAEAVQGIAAVGRKGESKPSMVDLRAAQCQRELAPVERGALPEGMDVFFAKSTLRRSAMFQTEYRMLSMSECSGILASGDRAFLVYTATTDGLAWGKRNANYDPKIVKAFGAVHGMRLYTAGGGKVPGILLARTPHVLASVFFDRARRKNKSRFGEGLSPLYVIPATDDGGVFIHHILHHDVRKVYYDVLHSFLDSGEYAQNTDAHSQSEYPLVEIATGALCAYGIDMKLDLLAWWYDDVCGLKNDPAAPPRKMICMESQVPYYQKIFGELPVEYIPMTWA